MESVHLMHIGFLNLGSTEIIIVLVVAVLLFGGRLPEIARSLGKVFFDLKRNVRDLQDEIYRQDYSPPPRSLPKPYVEEPEPEDRETSGEDSDSSQEESSGEDGKSAEEGPSRTGKSQTRE